MFIPQKVAARLREYAQSPVRENRTAGLTRRGLETDCYVPRQSSTLLIVYPPILKASLFYSWALGKLISKFTRIGPAGPMKQPFTAPILFGWLQQKFEAHLKQRLKLKKAYGSEAEQVVRDETPHPFATLRNAEGHGSVIRAGTTEVNAFLQASTGVTDLTRWTCILE